MIMYCYALNGRCPVPAHIWLTGCKGEMQDQLTRIPGYDRWLIEKEDKSYIESFKDQKENLVYLTADSENVLDVLDPKAIYIIGGLVDRNRWKGLTMDKANEQGIKTAKLPIGSYLKMSSSQVLTVNQVVEILLKFLESGDWKHSFFEVIPLRKRGEAGTEGEGKDEDETEAGADDEDSIGMDTIKRQKGRASVQRLKLEYFNPRETKQNFVNGLLGVTDIFWYLILMNN
ncbi:tRNA (guanine(9)-N1)-methyltransferase-like [Salvia splendens]|uniref:tRNA (guanine(9)-N1)-methyltransferase-like n=1 Tax=Salvia splendens TaxID=180675 RepID=UPI001C257DC6|nr:tRNA (guanine(9)-N1)-methyltransferase-like [Salvia splendens]